jgi:hypothetical protein
MDAVPGITGAYCFSRNYKDPRSQATGGACSPPNPLWEYFQNHKSGSGIWKWEHYFDVYQRHFSKFVGQRVNVLEIGIYSGGSLEMWWSYFGNESHIFGVDIEPACKSYENDHTSVFIGDQADRGFWKTFKSSVDGIDIFIDDGGHTPEQQKVTLEEMLPHLRQGGVYICEDIHGRANKFAGYASALVDELNHMDLTSGPLLQSNISPFQSSIHSIHFYPYLMVIEKHLTRPTKFSAPKNGTEWQPFFD